MPPIPKKTKPKARRASRQQTVTASSPPAEPVVRPWTGKTLYICPRSGAPIYLSPGEADVIRQNTRRNADAEVSRWLADCKPHIARKDLGGDSEWNIRNPGQQHPPMPPETMMAIAADIRRDCALHNAAIDRAEALKRDLKAAEEAAIAERFRQARANAAGRTDFLKERLRRLKEATFYLR